MVGCAVEPAPPRPIVAPALPPVDDGFLLGAVGAPQPIFGPQESPDFVGGFSALRAAGFNRFVPFFLTSESGQGTTHTTYFLPPTNAAAKDISCAGPKSAWAALPPGLSLTFPAFVLVASEPTTSLLDPKLARARLATLKDCAGWDAAKLGEGYLYDEPALSYLTSLYDKDPATYRLENVATLSAAVHDTWGKPTVVVEAPVPFVLDYSKASPGDVAVLTPKFWDAVAQVTPAADFYGFDVYPVDITADLSVIPQFVGEAVKRAPTSKPVAVLQGSSYKDMSIPLGDQGRRPTRDETRAMAFAAIAAGAHGIYWYGGSALHLGDSLWDDITEVARDIHKLSGVLALPPVTLPTPVNSAVVRATRSGSTTWFVVANPTSGPLEVELPATQNSYLFEALTGTFLQSVSAPGAHITLPAYAGGAFTLSPVETAAP